MSMKHTMFSDVLKEVEWQKTEAALGKPVDHQCLFEIIEQLQLENEALRDAAEEAVKDKKAAEDEKEEEENKSHDLEEIVTVIWRELLSRVDASALDKKLVDRTTEALKKAK